MRSWTGLALARRCVLYAALVLVIVMLTGALSPRRVLGQTEVRQLSVSFSPSTPPVQPGVICKDETYQILVRPLLYIPDVEVGDVPLLHSIIFSLSEPSFGILNGQTGPSARYSSGGVAVLTYKAQQTGQEILNFGWTDFVPPTLRPNSTYEDVAAMGIIQGDTQFTFEVRECAYKVIFESRYQYRQAGLSATNLGLMAETMLERKEDGTFEGSGTFVITNLVSSQICTASYSDAGIVSGITGELQPDGSELTLRFTYGKGTYVTDAVCPRAAATTTSSLDISGIAPRSMRTPASGGTKFIPLPGPGQGHFSITVKKVTR